jgi:hypothetical protein
MCIVKAIALFLRLPEQQLQAFVTTVDAAGVVESMPAAIVDEPADTWHVSDWRAFIERNRHLLGEQVRPDKLAWNANDFYRRKRSQPLQQFWHLRVECNLPGRGNGLFARCTIPNGAVVCDYLGRYVGRRDHERRIAELRRSGDLATAELIESYGLQVGRGANYSCNR